MGSLLHGLMLRQEFLKVPLIRYINDLADGLSSNTKLFADDTSLFCVIHDAVITTLQLNSDLVRIKLGFSVEDEF